jgi:hypothetical protein
MLGAWYDALPDPDRRRSVLRHHLGPPSTTRTILSHAHESCVNLSMSDLIGSFAARALGPFAVVLFLSQTGLRRPLILGTVLVTRHTMLVPWPCY